MDWEWSLWFFTFFLNFLDSKQSSTTSTRVIDMARMDLSEGAKLLLPHLSHPRFAAANAWPTSRLPLVWGCTPAQARAGRYRPLSPSSGNVSRRLTPAYLSPGAGQQDTTLARHLFCIGTNLNGKPFCTMGWQVAIERPGVWLRAANTAHACDWGGNNWCLARWTGAWDGTPVLVCRGDGPVLAATIGEYRDTR